MKLYLLSDNRDSLTGLRLAGIEGKFVSAEDEVIEQTQKILEDQDIGILLITLGLSKLCPDFFLELKKRNYPLLVEIPDSNPDAVSGDSVTEYIRNAVGIKI